MQPSVHAVLVVGMFTGHKSEVVVCLVVLKANETLEARRKHQINSSFAGMTHPLDAIGRDAAFLFEPGEVRRLDDLQAGVVDVLSCCDRRLDLAQQLSKFPSASVRISDCAEHAEDVPQCLIGVEAVRAGDHMVVGRVIAYIEYCLSEKTQRSKAYTYLQ